MAFYLVAARPGGWQPCADAERRVGVNYQLNMLPRGFKIPRLVSRNGLTSLIKTNFWFVSIKPNNLPHPRFAVTVGSNFGNAVVRHKFKRIVWDILRKQNVLRTGDLFIQLKPELSKLNPKEAKKLLAGGFSKIFTKNNVD